MSDSYSSIAFTRHVRDAQERYEHTFGWADFRGNRQHISAGNIAGDARVSVLFLDYPRQLRLKFDVREDPAVARALTVAG